ncbi:unnamed protein product, partial [Rotaria socialis]
APKLYVETIAELHKKFDVPETEGFSRGEGFTSSRDKAFREFVNNNAVTTAAGNTSKSPE